jgi:hypothetical protein
MSMARQGNDGKAKREALVGLGRVVWKAASKMGWLGEQQVGSARQTSDSAERSAGAAERTVDAAESKGK